LCRNLTNSSTGTISSEPVYDPYLFTPTASIHDTDTLTELKTKAIGINLLKSRKVFRLRSIQLLSLKEILLVILKGCSKRIMRNLSIFENL
jgi:hypothetical protein